jgi:large subunit ribosomal protein L18
MNIQTKQEKRQWRHSRVRSKVVGTSERPRLVVHKSNTRLSAQLIDDEKGTTLASSTSAGQKGKTLKERAESAATELAEAAKKNNVERVVFDHGGFGYKGVIKSFADSARNAGLQF